MEFEDFSVGNIVYLKSGSPPLTVSLVDEDDETIKVNWINKQGEIEEFEASYLCFKQ